MIKKLQLLLVLLVPVIAFGQTADSVKRKRVEIGISFSPDIAYRTLKADADSKPIADERNTMEEAKFGYTAGVNAAFKVNKHLNIDASILFSDNGERTKDFSLSTFGGGQQATKYAFNYHYYYLNIPVKVDYFLVTGKLKFYVTAGLSANFFLGQTTTEIMEYNNSTTRKNTNVDPGFSAFNLGMVTGCGIRYPVGKRTDLLVEPVYRRSLTSIIDAPIKGYLYSGGLTVGVYYNL